MGIKPSCLPAGTKHVSAQMAVELMVCIPVMIVIAVIALNAVLFFSECAAYDNVFREAVRVHAASPAYGQNYSDALQDIDACLSQRFTSEHMQSSVSVQGTHEGYVVFTATLTMQPTLFGMGLRSRVFGVALPSVVHEVSLTVDSYKPGVVL